MAPRTPAELLADLADALDAAAEIAARGKQQWETERVLRLAGEAVLGRIGDIASKLPQKLIDETPMVPWKEVRGARIIVAHAYHRIDYEQVWRVLSTDLPHMERAVSEYVKRHAPELGISPTDRWMSVVRRPGGEGPEEVRRPRLPRF